MIVNKNEICKTCKNKKKCIEFPKNIRFDSEYCQYQRNKKEKVQH